MTSGTRLRPVASVVVVAGVLTLAACTSKSGGDEASAPVGIEISQFSIVVENRSGGPLSDVKVIIVPVGSSTLYSTSPRRLEGSEKRDVSFNDFHGRDGTPFDRRVVRPKAVRVTGTDVMGKPIEREVRWR